MGKKDILVSDFFDDNGYFADMENAYFLEKQVIKPEDLKDASKERLHTETIKGKRTLRDNVKKYAPDLLLCIYIMEQQQQIDYHMVLRDMLGVAMEYERQWKEKKQEHQRKKDLKKGHEFISGMKKEERFIPVISLVVYYGEEKWDAARCLYDLLEMEHISPFLKEYIENYHIHIFDYHDYENFDMFHTDLKQVFTFLKNSFDKNKLKKMIAEHWEEYYTMSRKACELVAVLTNSEELLELDRYQNEENGGIDMCKALLELRQEGVEEGISQGIQALVEDYLEEGFSKEKILTKLMKHFSLSRQEAEAYFEKYAVSCCMG